MKKEYINPAMRLIELKHRHHLLAGSNPNMYNNSSYRFFKDVDETIADDNYEEGDVI